MKRVYHPTLDAWQDVPDERLESWLSAGWKSKRPKQFDDELPPVGSHPGYARVVNETPTPEPEPAVAEPVPPTPDVQPDAG